jgi:hypothetical protein
MRFGAGAQQFMMYRSGIVALRYIDIAMQHFRGRLRLRIVPRRIDVKKTTLSIAAATAFVIAGSAAGLAAELPTYETRGLPISAVQVQVLGAADVREQSPVATSTVTAHQVSVLTRRTKLTAATAPRTTGVATH